MIEKTFIVIILNFWVQFTWIEILLKTDHSDTKHMPLVEVAGVTTKWDETRSRSLHWVTEGGGGWGRMFSVTPGKMDTHVAHPCSVGMICSNHMHKQSVTAAINARQCACLRMPWKWTQTHLRPRHPKWKKWYVWGQRRIPVKYHLWPAN